MSETPDAERQAFPESWIPSPGDTIAGRFVRLDEGHGKKGDVAKIVVLVDEAGQEHSVWLWHSVLQAEFAKAKPEVGELVRVIYRGKKTGTAHEYHDYVVDTPERVPAAPNWDSLEWKSADAAPDDPDGPPF